ncbi:hypothetical protein LTR08_001568 [Meristemomyces frigidus]|nr:hypothetical protein LTR08_001568 [Meristemomyces frigidus]
MAWYYESYRGYTDFYDLDSWVEISSQPSSSSLSSINDEIVTAGLRVQHDPRTRRRRTLRPGAPSHLHINNRALSTGTTSSQEEYEESESESDKLMSSGEGLQLPGHRYQAAISPAFRSSSSESAPQVSDDDDENRTAINYPIHNDVCFTPQPNAFSHPPSAGQTRNTSAPVPESYFPSTRFAVRPATRQYLPTQPESARQSHMPQNILSPSYNAAAQHDEALRASLNTLLSCAAAARGLATTNNKRANTATAAPARGNRAEPMSFRLVPGSAVPGNPAPQLQEPMFQPTIRRHSTSTSASSDRMKENKRKATVTTSRSSSRERHALKKARRSSATSAEELAIITPTMLTWLVSAGVVLIFSAVSFSAGYSIGKEAGRMEVSGGAFAAADERLIGCAKEASRSGLGLKRSLARSVAV